MSETAGHGVEIYRDPSPDPSAVGRAESALELMVEWLPWLNEAGLDAKVARDRLLFGTAAVLEAAGSRIAYRTAEGRREVEASRPTLERLLRQIVLGRRRGSFERDVSNALQRYPSLELRSHPLGVRVCLRGADVAMVTPDTATVLETITIQGNFLVPGQHWKSLTEACCYRGLAILREQRETRSRGCYRLLPMRTAIRVFSGPPVLSVELIEDADAASRSIRLHRCTALGHRARLRGQECTLYFDPVRSVGMGLAVPFEYREDAMDAAEDRAICGILSIQRESDPLPVTLEENRLSDFGARAWAASILAFRAISVPETVEPTSYRRMTRRRGVKTQSSTHSWSSRNPTIYWERLEPDYWSSSVMLDRSPVGPHWVVGHKRVLPAGQSASPEKISEAASYGIPLEPGETWVSPHARGASSDTVMPFYWDCPEALRVAISNATQAAA
jgi:hypothetical protein